MEVTITRHRSVARFSDLRESDRRRQTRQESMNCCPVIDCSDFWASEMAENSRNKGSIFSHNSWSKDSRQKERDGRTYKQGQTHRWAKETRQPDGEREEEKEGGSKESRSLRTL